VLWERASLGRTVIEKFEYYASRSDIAFVVATPDDLARLANDPVYDGSPRARQNVIFEYGYFCGYFKRLSGRVILLHKGLLELPSDVSGVVYIDISAGVESVGEQIRTELAEWC
jgi:predicted nucleotide-binding protein